MAFVDRLMNFFETALETGLEYVTNVIPGAIIDNVAGIGGDGRWGSSAEQYIGAGKKAADRDIHVHTSKVNVHNAESQVNDVAIEQTVTREASPARIVTQEEQLSAEEWYHQAKEAVQTSFVQRAAENKAASDVTNNTEQSLYALAVNPIQHYTNEDAFYQMLEEQRERERDQQHTMRR